MTKKKKKTRTELHVVRPSEQHQESPLLEDAEIWSVGELTSRLKKARKRIKKLENALTVVNVSRNTLEEKHVALEKEIETLDTRTTRMGIALRECMKKLGVARPE